MKCTLRKVDGGIVATIDERPKIRDLYWNQINSISVRSPLLENRYYKTCHKIIASTIPNVGKEFVVNDESIGFLEELEFDKEYDYTETETQVIIEL